MLFANLEAVTNAMVLNHLSNVEVVIGGVPVPGMFRKPSAVSPVGLGVDSSAPTITVASGAVMAEPVGKSIVIGATEYEILETDPDGTGLTKLILLELP